MRWITREDIDHMFEHHPSHADDVLRKASHEFATAIVTNTPGNPMQVLAVRKVQEALMWAKAAMDLDKGS